ncbi:MAG: hypothetical protein OT477_12735 [Chloroflexi bacterium]|nr:hypothetical protein [Chloroflexota bacterium]
MAKRVTIVRWGVFILGGVQGWQIWAISQQMAVLRPLSPSFPPETRLVLVAVWCIIWLGLAGVLWRGRPWVRWAVPSTILLYTTYHLVLLATAVSPYARGGWTGNLLLGLAAAVFTTWALKPSANQSVS